MLRSASLLIGLFLAGAAAAETAMFKFDTEQTGAAPAGFVFAKTGRGRPGKWVVEAEGAAGANRVLAQRDADPVDMRLPMAIVDAIVARDVDVSVRFRPLAGEEDQAAGLVWRYRDKDNYYVVRANALEDNVVLYKVEKGRRSDLPLKGKGKTYGAKAGVPKLSWSTLRVTAEGRLFTVYLNGQKLYEVEDDTFKEAGKVGVWTKADSVTQFDDLTVTTRH